MNTKKLLIILLISLFCTLSFAEGGYRISVKSADNMAVSGDVITFKGNVVIDFKTSDGSSSNDRQLFADQVYVDMKLKKLDAIGHVHLEDSKDSTFDGDSVSLDWETLDVVVFGGNSSSDRSNTSGNNVRFFITGDRIAYSGDSDAVFFEDGIIATREEDPYWSINAKKLALAESDIFFSGATLKLGRVPIFWLPVLFYPGNRLSFNPAIGVSSTKGMFLNTTYELYGKYPGIGDSGQKKTDSSDSEQTDDATALATNFLSFLDSEKDSNSVRSGWSYKSLADDQLTKTQLWARKTGSYFAIMADAWEKYGLSLGYDTKNYFDNKNLVLSSVGVIGYRNQPENEKINDIRYSFNLNVDYKHNKTRLTLSLPFLSDPSVKSDFLNRNTVFGLDSVFGADQSFPSTYSNDISKYSMILDGSTSWSNNRFKFELTSLKSQINYKWNADEHKYVISDGELPYISVNSSGDIVSWEGKANTVKKDVKLSSKYARDYYGQLLEYDSENASEENTFEEVQIGDLKAFAGSAVQTTKDVKEEAPYVKLSYKYAQNVDNKYAEDLKHTSLYTKIDSSVTLKARTPKNIFSFSDTLAPVFDTSVNEDTQNSTSFKLQNTFSAGFPILGITYNLKNNMYLYENTEKKQVDRKGNWDKTDVLDHNVSFEKKLSDFKISLKYVLPPLDQKIIPGVSYSHSGFSFSSDMSFVKKEEEAFKKDVFHLNIGYKKNWFDAAINSTYDFKKEGDWAGYSGVQTLALSFVDSKLKFNEKMNLEKKFEVKDLSLTLSYDKNYVTYTFIGKDLKSDTLKLYLYQNITPVYAWKNRLGFEGTLDFGFTYDFQNKYNSTLSSNLKFNFSLSRFLDLSLNIKSKNNSFYRYYETDDSGNESFKLMMVLKDLGRSFDFFGKGRKNTGFIVDSYSITAVHYMEDWTLTLTASSQVKTVNGKLTFIPEFTFLVKWNAIPELKSNNKWDSSNGWDK